MDNIIAFPARRSPRESEDTDFWEDPPCDRVIAAHDDLDTPDVGVVPPPHERDALHTDAPPYGIDVMWDWRRAPVFEDDIISFQEMGIGPDRAEGWGIRAHQVRGFLLAGIGIEEAQVWTDLAVSPGEACLWRAAGFGPEHLIELRTLTTAPGFDALWALTGLDPRDALEHARAGASPIPFFVAAQPAPREHDGGLR